MLKPTDMIRRLPFFEGEGAGGGAAAGDPPAAAAGAAGAGDPPAAAAGAAGDPPAAKWWENTRFSDAERQHLTASGLTVDDPSEAVQKLTGMHLAAVRRLGKSPDDLLDRPKKDQPLADWMKANREVFGLPEAPEGYEIARPDAWPKDAAWNDDLEKAARAIAHEHGIPPAALNAMVGLYATDVMRLEQAASEGYQAATAAMMADLRKDWGDQTQAKMTEARQGAAFLAEQAGLSGEQVEALTQLLSDKVGDAGVMRIFQIVGANISDETAVALTGGGATGFATTPAEARAEHHKLTNPGGEYFEATRRNDQRAIESLQPRIDMLRKIMVAAR